MSRPVDPQTARTIAWNIRSELVCCNAYDLYEGHPELAEELGHGLCFWGEAAARLAESTIVERADAPCECIAWCPVCQERCLGGHANYPDLHWCADLHTWTDEGALLGYLVKVRTREEWNEINRQYRR